MERHGFKQDLGYALYQLQLRQTPPDRKPVRTVGPGVYELREQDADKWYRVLYAREGSTIHVLHCFEKRSSAIEQKDIETAKTRLESVLEAKSNDALYMDLKGRIRQVYRIGDALAPRLLMDAIHEGYRVAMQI